MKALATLQSTKGHNRRAQPRRSLHLDTRLGPPRGEKVTIHDLSPTGILIETAAALTEFDQLAVELPEAGTTMATVIWSSGHYFGCQFHDVLPRSAISAALLRSPFEPAVAKPAVSEPAPPEPVPPLQTLVTHDRQEDEEIAEPEDDRLPFAVRLRFILGTSIASWALILWAMGVL